MNRPLYRAAAAQPASPEPEGNAGLWFDKFCNRWGVTNGSWSMSSDGTSNPKIEWLQSLTGRGPIGAQNQIEECALRLMRLIDRRGGRAAVFTTESRFVTGLGRSHPVENGFAWHPTLGTPYLPGSSVKGMVRSWAETDADPHPDEETLARLLGKAGQAGSICFLDAVPVVRIQLEVDVMTPHYAGWSENDPPGDWRSPNPIPFLTTAAGGHSCSVLFPAAPLQIMIYALFRAGCAPPLPMSAAARKQRSVTAAFVTTTSKPATGCSGRLLKPAGAARNKSGRKRQRPRKGAGA